MKGYVLGTAPIQLADIIDVVPTLYAGGAAAAGTILFGFTKLQNTLSSEGAISFLQSIAIKDKADTGATITLIFADQSGVSLGTLGAAPSISDADDFNLLGTVAIAATDWLDLGGCRVASLKNIGLMLEAAAGVDVYVAGIITAGGTGGTFTATDIELSCGIMKG